MLDSVYVHEILELSRSVRKTHYNTQYGAGNSVHPTIQLLQMELTINLFKNFKFSTVVILYKNR